jgi:aspartate/methionine/tyrosine aminotransferase
MGCFLSGEDLGVLEDHCQKEGRALLMDEVFTDDGMTRFPSLSGRALTFRFGGLSKCLGLPQLKLSWVVMDGPSGLLDEALERLEFIADSYLSVSTPVQAALPSLLEAAPKLQTPIRERIARNRGVLMEAFIGSKRVKVWPSQGGWYGLLEVLGPELKDEDIAEALVVEKGVLVHPGMFFDFPKGCFLIVSLLLQEGRLREGLERIKGYFRDQKDG